jgi:hypothetical protein
MSPRIAARIAPLLLALGFCCAQAADEGAAKPNRVERAAQKTGQAIERGAKKTGKAIEHAARKTGKALDHAANKTDSWIKKKTE